MIPTSKYHNQLCRVQYELDKEMFFPLTECYDRFDTEGQKTNEVVSGYMPARPRYRMSRRAPEEFARKAEEAKHRSNEAQRSAFVLRRRTRQILSEAGPRRVLLQLFSRREKFFF